MLPAKHGAFSHERLSVSPRVSEVTKHIRPPTTGAGSLHSRVRNCVLTPQSEMHPLHAPHIPQLPLAETQHSILIHTPQYNFHLMYFYLICTN